MDGTELLVMYVIYDHPSDYPESFAVRRWTFDGPDPECRTAASLEEARALVPPEMVNIGRNDKDDRAIVEVWV